MNDIFVDGIRSIAVANGVARIELLQLKRGQSKSKLEPEVVGVLMLPVASLKDFSTQLASTLQKLNEAAIGQDVPGVLKTRVQGFYLLNMRYLITGRCLLAHCFVPPRFVLQR